MFRDGSSPRSVRPARARSLVTVAVTASGAAAATPQGKHMARRALLAGGAAAAPALLAAQAAFAKKPAKPKGPSRSSVDAPHPVTKVDLDGRRLVAIGDLHGDFKQAMRALQVAKVMGEDGKWCGGTSVLVQVGDILDRGDNELAIMRKFRALAKEAKAAGGDVIVTNGNHEIMNVLGDFRYATKGAYGECARYAANKREKEIAKVGEENVEPLPEVPTVSIRRRTWVSSLDAICSCPAVRWPCVWHPIRRCCRLATPSSRTRASISPPWNTDFRDSTTRLRRG